MSLTQKDKENLLKMLNDPHNFNDLKLVLETLIVLEDFTREND